jgi:NADH/F420H2 dehydrogenase subunit C
LAFAVDEPSLSFNVLMDLGGVDYLDYGDDREWRFEVAYQLYSIAHNHRFRIKVAVTEADPTVPSVWDLFGVANWMEREVYDMFGITFSEHPNLRRILCHEDFEGHALRKDYPINRRQQLSRPIDNLLTDDPNHA